MIAEDHPDFILKLDLRRPVGMQGEIPTICFRKPRAGDIARWGVPIKRDLRSSLSEFEIIADRMNNMIAILADLPPPAIANMDANDWAIAADVIAVAFLPLEKPPAEAVSST